MIGNNAYRSQTFIWYFVGWSWQFFRHWGLFISLSECRTLMLLPVALVEIYNHNLRSVSAWRNLCNYAHGIDINIWGSHKASCEPLSENWRSNHIEYAIFPSTILSHPLWHVWNFFIYHDKYYGLIAAGYQGISWTSPGNLVLDTREWSYTGESSI